MTDLRKVTARPEKPAPRYVRERPEVRRQQLIDAAIRCLGTGGISAFTIDRICRAAGVSRGLINHYFASKDDLLIAVYKSSLYETVTGHIAQTGGVDDSSAPASAARLTALVEANFAPDYFAKANFLVWLSLWSEVATNPKLKTAHSALYDSYRKALAREIQAVAAYRERAVNANNLARNFIAMVDGLWLEWSLDSGVLSPADAKEACYEFLEVYLGPLRPVRGDTPSS